MHKIYPVLIAVTVALASAGCSTDKTGQSTGPQDWKKQAPPASYIEQAKAHDAQAPPRGGPPPTSASTAPAAPPY